MLEPLFHIICSITIPVGLGIVTLVRNILNAYGVLLSKLYVVVSCRAVVE